MIRLVAFATLLSCALWAGAAPTPTVDCDAGQSLNHTLAKMDKFTPATVTVKGTCTEYVLIDGFHGLTVKGVQGATVQQPVTNPHSNQYVLSIKGSQGITVAGLAVHSLPSIFSGIGISGASSDVRLQHVTTDGSWGVVVAEASQVWLVKLTVNLTSGYAAVSAFDKSDVHIVDGLLQRPANGAFNAGILVGSGHVTIQGMTIRDMQQSITINGGGSVDLVNFDPTAAGIDVVIDNPSGTNFNGVLVGDGSSLNLGSAKLRITNAGQSWGGDTGAVFVFNGSTLNAASNLVISGSQGQGVIVSNNSHAELGGSSITGGAHGGLVVVNLSTATADQTNPLTAISANGTDVFCDSKSQIAGALNIANATVVQCNNLLPGNYESLP
jgi:hypothetical protein